MDRRLHGVHDLERGPCASALRRNASNSQLLVETFHTLSILRVRHVDLLIALLLVPSVICVINVVSNILSWNIVVLRPIMNVIVPISSKVGNYLRFEQRVLMVSALERGLLFCR